MPRDASSLLKNADSLHVHVILVAAGVQRAEETLMGMRRRPQERQQECWIASAALAAAPRHVFYDKLNGLLDVAGFDAFVEELCEPFYSAVGRDSIPPGRYFRMLFVGYLEGLDSQTALTVTTLRRSAGRIGG
jgi:hypothetical protein